MSEARTASPATPFVIVAHQWRTPMTLVRGCLDTLLTRWNDLDDGQRRRFIEIAHERAGELAGALELALTAMEPVNSG